MNLNCELNRRTFLSTLVATGSAGLLARLDTPQLRAASQTAAAPAPISPWQIGCYTRVFDQFEYGVALDAIAAAGFKHVGLMTNNTKQWVMVKASTPKEEIEGMHKAAAARGLNILSVYGDFQLDTASTSASADSLKRLIDHCATCSCHQLLLGGTSDEKLYRPYYECLRACCAHAAEAQVTMSIKPHGGQNATGPQCRKAIEMVGHRNFGLWYDPGNVFYYSDGKLDPVEDSKTVDGLVVGMSAKDYLPPKDVLVNPGSGKVDFPNVMANLRKGGFKQGPVILECLKRGTLSEVQSAATNARIFLDKLLSS